MIYLKYIWYLLRHKYYVLIECWNKGLFWLGIIHDWSKFRPSEFIPYARYFYGYYGYKFNGGFIWEFRKHWGIIHDYNYAWLLHQKRNKHHWQYWVLIMDEDKDINLLMPAKYTIEMLCDWRGAGIAITGTDNTSEWYRAHKNKIRLNSTVRNYIEANL